MTSLERLLFCCAPLPALALGVAAMRHAGVPKGAWIANIVAAIVGVLLVLAIRGIPSTRRMQFALAAIAIVIIVSAFFFSGSGGVHRWLALGGVRLHAASLVAPILIVCVAALAGTQSMAAIAIAALTTAILALQPDAALATSFAAACCAAVLCRSRAWIGAALLVVLAMLSFARPDPLPPVPHVEGILSLVGHRGIGILALLLLPLPFVVQFIRHRHCVSLALGIYVASITIAPFWGTFPVPVMGYGVSPIVGYFIALAFSLRCA